MYYIKNIMVTKRCLWENIYLIWHSKHQLFGFQLPLVKVLSVKSNCVYVIMQELVIEEVLIFCQKARNPRRGEICYCITILGLNNQWWNLQKKKSN